MCNLTVFVFDFVSDCIFGFFDCLFVLKVILIIYFFLTSTMEIAAEKLEALINQAEINLETIEYQLEVELNKLTGEQIKPVQIIASIEDAKLELEELKKEKNILIGQHEEIKEKLTKKIEILVKRVQSMEKKIGYKNKLSSAASSVMKSHLKMTS